MSLMRYAIIVNHANQISNNTTSSATMPPMTEHDWMIDVVVVMVCVVVAIALMWLGTRSD